MRTTKVIRVAAAAAAAAILLAGCGSSSPESDAASGGDVAASAEGVDAAALNTGDFPTLPQPAYGTADPEKAIWIEGQRMAEFVVLPFELDMELTDPLPSGPLTDAGDLDTYFSDKGAAVAAESMVAGYRNGGSTPDGTENDHSIRQLVLRLTDNAAATSAARRIHDILVTEGHEGNRIGKTENIDVLPNTLVSSVEGTDYQTKEPNVAITAFTVHDDYLIYHSAYVPIDQKDWAAKTIAEAVRQQEPLLDKFPATPVDKIKDIKIDQDDVLIYALPREGGALASSEEAVYGPRGLVQGTDDRIPDAARLYTLLNDTGTDRIAVYASYVYRTKSPESAQKLMDGYLAASRDYGWVDAPSPAGLPEAKCIRREGSNTCMVANGRYVGRVMSGTMDEMHQAVAAQYLILQGAE